MRLSREPRLCSKPLRGAGLSFRAADDANDLRSLTAPRVYPFCRGHNTMTLGALGLFFSGRLSVPKGRKAFEWHRRSLNSHTALSRHSVGQ